MKIKTLLTLGLTVLLAVLVVRAGQEEKQCELHGEKMAPRNVPIIYGYVVLPEYDQQMEAAAKGSFPHASDYVFGGCIVEKEKEMDVLECPACRKAKTEWAKANPN